MLSQTQLKSARSDKTAVVPLQDAALVAAFVLIVYHAFTFYNTINPELPSFWVQFRFTSWKALAASYLNLGTNFYRPTVFHVFLGGLGAIVDWHNVAAFRYLSLILMVGNCLAIYALARVAWHGSRYAAIGAAVYFAANPSTYIVVTEFFYSDYISVLLLISTVLFFRASLKARGRTIRITMAAAAMVMFLLNLTSRENAFLSPIFLLFIALRHVYDRARDTSDGAFRRAVATLAPFALLSLAFIALRLTLLQRFSNSGGYRTQANWDYITDNMFRMFAWMAHVFRLHLSDYIDIHDGPLENFVGLILTAAAFSGWLLLFRRNWRDAAWGLGGCILWILLFISLAVYAGYAPWHIYTALVGYAVFAGLGIAELLRLIPWDRWRTTAAIAALTCVCVLAQYFYIKQATHPNRSVFYKLNYNAIQNPPALKSGGAGDVLIFYGDSIGLNDWVFGGGNNLFKFVYENPALQERRIVNSDSLSAKECLNWLSHNKAYYLRFTPEFQWYDDSPALSRTCLLKVAEESDRLLAAGKAAEVSAMLKPIAGRYPEDGMHTYQYALSLEYSGKKEEAAEYYRKAVDGMPARFWVELGDGRIRSAAPAWPTVCADSRGKVTVPGVMALTAARCGAGKGR